MAKSLSVILRKVSRPKILSALLVLTVFFYPVIYASFHGFTTFESSDANWWDKEVLLKGRGLDSMVFQFELYKLRCDAPTATLIRTTPKNPFNVLAWPGYLYDENWKLPYRPPSKKSHESFIAATIGKRHCYNTPKTDQDLDLAHQATQKFMMSLSSIKQPSLFEK
ncbi:MAG TPA: hypothetical protein PLD20_09735 [Blastocatellia bacterium]|nr:hypothetical protein [Blastocatellia bacterium]HMX24859.1 hypothetical protein [Blastocatellia bacterium]HMZ18200.1 hypothetical protein [Blastocatellia bacterium]HNG33919.1 hypothetical protein [Blastocatellia bacterium]